MQRSPSLLLLTTLLALVVCAAAQARPIDDLRKAKLQAVTGTVTVSESRCPPGSTSCGKTKLDEKFATGSAPKTRSAPGLPGFPTGLKIVGQGTGECYAESPVTASGPDDSQILTSAARLTPGKFRATRVAVAASKRGVRIVWLDPLRPSISCDYFDQAGTLLSLPPAAEVPKSLVSPTIGARMLKRERFSVTIAGSKDWSETAADGQLVTGSASWKLRLDYVARGRSAAPHRSGAR
jgi:hypothetical protein